MAHTHCPYCIDSELQYDPNAEALFCLECEFVLYLTKPRKVNTRRKVRAISLV